MLQVNSQLRVMDLVLSLLKLRKIFLDFRFIEEGRAEMKYISKTERCVHSGKYKSILKKPNFLIITTRIKSRNNKFKIK